MTAMGRLAPAGGREIDLGAYDLTDANAAARKVEHLTGNWVGVFRKDADGTWTYVAFAATPSPARR